MGPAPAVAEVRLAVRRVLTRLPPGSLALVACSGGADSMALAAAAAFEAPRAQLRCGGVTVDHQLQPGSGEQTEKVARSLLDLGLSPVEVLPVDVGRAGGPEAAARTARYAALEEAAHRLGAAVVLLGHTRDDQAETVLLGLARGSGARSLAGMPAESGIYCRPLLEVPRVTVRAAAEGLPVWDDPHNEDPAFARSRVRGRVLPTLEAALGPGVADALARTAKLLRADADALDAIAVAAHASLVGESDSGDQFEVSALRELPDAVRTRVLRRALLTAGSPGTDLTAAHVATVDALLTDWHGQGPIHLPQGVRASRTCGRLLLEREWLIS